MRFFVINFSKLAKIAYSSSIMIVHWTSISPISMTTRMLYVQILFFTPFVTELFLFLNMAQWVFKWLSLTPPLSKCQHQILYNLYQRFSWVQLLLLQGQYHERSLGGRMESRLCDIFRWSWWEKFIIDTAEYMLCS